MGRSISFCPASRASAGGIAGVDRQTAAPICRPFWSPTFRYKSRFQAGEEPGNRLKMLTFRHESRFADRDSKSAEVYPCGGSSPPSGISLLEIWHTRSSQSPVLAGIVVSIPTTSTLSVRSPRRRSVFKWEKDDLTIPLRSRRLAMRRIRPA